MSIESSDEYPAAKNDSTKTSDPVHKKSATERLMLKAHENKVLITLWLAIATFIVSEVWSARDSALRHEILIAGLKEDIKELQGDVKTLLAMERSKP